MRAFDANYRLTDLTSPALNLHFARDAMGDITALGNAPGANPAIETYSYDPLYRLTAITEAGGTVLESATYNPTGDRTSKSGSGLATGSYSYNPNTHQLIGTGSATRSVDANGNTTAIAQAGVAYGFGYNARDRLTVAQLGGSTVGSYTYNALGQRIGKSAASTERFVYGEGSQLLSEYGTNNRDYVWLGDLPVATVDTSGTTSAVSYVTADHLGTPRAVADSSGIRCGSGRIRAIRGVSCSRHQRPATRSTCVIPASITMLKQAWPAMVPGTATSQPRDGIANPIRLDSTAV